MIAYKGELNLVGFNKVNTKEKDRQTSLTEHGFKCEIKHCWLCN